MSSAHPASRLGAHGKPLAGAKPPSRVRQAASELPMRTLIGLLLALVAIGVTFAGGYLFSAFIALAAFAAAREWHRLFETKHFAAEWAVTSTTIAFAIVAVTLSLAPVWPLAILFAGAMFAAALSAIRRAPILWSGLGAAYIGIPACALVALRGYAAHAEWIVLGVFVVVWTADTGALAVGKILRGPKLVPWLSPNKTWAGLAGGLVLPSLALAIYVAAFGGNPFRAFGIGFLLAAAGHLGDLFESWIKRRVGRKDSGESIPGHGGVLDRVDSTLFVAPLAAGLVYIFGVARLFGVHT